MHSGQTHKLLEGWRSLLVPGPGNQICISAMGDNMSKPLRFRGRYAVELLESRRLLAAIVSGQTLSGDISATIERDSYTFNVNSGDSIRAAVAETVGDSAFSPSIELFDPDDIRVTWNTDNVGCDIGAFSVSKTGEYKLVIS